MDADLREFAAAMLHELRTPLTALSGEVEIALRRERSPAAYRDALTRIADLVAEIVELTGDLAYLGSTQAVLPSDDAVEFAALLGSLAARFGGTVTVNVDDRSGGLFVATDEKMLMRALTLLVDQALRHRQEGCVVRVDGHAGTEDGDEFAIVITAAPTGFRERTWDHLFAVAPPGSLDRPGLLRLRTASRLLDACGGRVRLDGEREPQALRVTLRHA